jgi:hypothetical protein
MLRSGVSFPALMKLLGHINPEMTMHHVDVALTIMFCVARLIARVHIDGSHHQWFQDERWYDLIVILDDASPLLVHLSLGDSMVRSFYTPQQAHARQAAWWREQLVPVQFWREPSKEMVVCWHTKSAEARI